MRAEPRSAFAAIRKLPPAHTLTWQDGVFSMRRYWRLSYDDAYAGAGEDEICELIRSTLLEARRLRLRSDVPVGALLSGGVDSSAVVAAMARLSAEPVRCFSIGFDLPKFDETGAARQVARLHGAGRGSSGTTASRSPTRPHSRRSRSRGSRGGR